MALAISLVRWMFGLLLGYLVRRHLVLSTVPRLCLEQTDTGMLPPSISFFVAPHLLTSVMNPFIDPQILTCFGCLRVALFGARSGRDVFAITLSLFVITLSSIITGACLPLVLDRIGFDPAHASTAIQVGRSVVEPRRPRLLFSD